jgi:hypothetical protein
VAPNNAEVADDLETARGALLSARRDMMARLLAAAVAETNPERIAAICRELSKLLERSPNAGK